MESVMQGSPPALIESAWSGRDAEEGVRDARGGETLKDRHRKAFVATAR
ncbi:MAG: hypothetical protein K2X67_21170 [Burkholderiales bacterium]|jgi:hypothetical protein|nr:hypothetical protein [Burkholderiales bacterium]